MGSSSSKAETENLRTPTKNIRPLNIDGNAAILNEADPRSPTFCRTPLNEVLATCQPITRNRDLSQINTSLSKAKTNHNPSDILKFKLLKGIHQSAFDPRSPSNAINRTPIIFNDSSLSTISTDISITENDQIINLNDSFADLEVDNKSSAADGKPAESPSNEVSENCDDLQNVIGTESTPLRKSQEKEKIDEFLMNDYMETIQMKENRVKKDGKNSNFIPRNNQLSNIIYQDAEDSNFTPKKRDSRVTNRTPLSCIANKSNYRSKSADNLKDTPKSIIRPLCFDDNVVNSQKPVKKALIDVTGGESPQSRLGLKTSKKHLLRKV